MNVNAKITMFFCSLGLFLSGCSSLINDDLSDCEQGVYIKLYSMTACDTDSTVVGHVPALTVFAFDENEKLVNLITRYDVDIHPEYELLMPVTDGYFSFVAWAGLDESKLSFSDFVIGQTSKKDLLFTLKSEANIAANLKNSRIWNGESNYVHLPPPSEVGSVFKHTSINLQELTNRIKISVELDESITAFAPHDLRVTLFSANGMVNIDGSMPLHTPIVQYPLLNTEYTGDTGVCWDYTTLALQTGYSSQLVIRLDNEDALIFNGDLIASILMKASTSGVNLKCENDFTIRFVLKDYCASCSTNFSCVVYVNNWLVHSYSAEF